MKCETDAKRSEARKFFEKILQKGHKIHCLTLKLSKLYKWGLQIWGSGGAGPLLGSASDDIDNF